MAPETDLTTVRTQSHKPPQLVNKLDKCVLSVMAEATTPLSADDIREILEVRGFSYSRQHIKRRLNSLTGNQVTELVGKRNKTELYRIVGQIMEPWEATSLVTNDPLIEVNGIYYTPDQMVKLIRTSSWPLLTHEHERDLRSLLQIMILGTSAYPVLKAHSILPVAHVRRSVEEYNARLKTMSKVIDTVLSHERIADGSTGHHITNETRDFILQGLEEFITKMSVNVRSDSSEVQSRQ